MDPTQDIRTKSVITKVTIVVIVLALLAGCSSGGGGKKDRTAPQVSASPPSMIFTDSTIDVTLTGMDDRQAPVTIHYTTDATIPTTASTVYTGPLTLGDTTVLKFLAVDRKGNESDVVTEGYTRALFPIEEDWANSGHGAILDGAFRHWDEDTEVPTSCARCHTGQGFVDFAQDGTVDNAAPLPLGHYCDSCHESAPLTFYDDLASYPALDPVEFPSGEHASLWGQSNMCIACHTGRSSKASVDDAIADDPMGPYRFINIHYYAAAASVFGTEVTGAYEYDGLEYVGRNTFPSHPCEQQTCVGCHMRGDRRDHTFVPQVSDCNTCHTGNTFETLSGSPSNHYQIITAMSAALIDEIRVYAANQIGVPIAYGDGYPYYFVDDNGNGVVDEGENSRYSDFDARLLKAAYNYQVVQKDPAGYIHNGTYLHQILHDSTVDLGGLPLIPAPGRPGFNRDNASKTDQWHLSGHAASTAEAFRHWDEDGEIPASCARCHSTPGFIDYAADTILDDPAPLGSLVECTACHSDFNLYANPETRYADLGENAGLEPVLFPSGATATFGNASNICMTCHQGRESGVSVDANSPNTVVQSPTDYDSFDFVNRHYYAAGAILFGSDVNAAYEYDGMTYAGQNLFAGVHGSLTDCIGCHMRGMQDHEFVPQTGDCSVCHQGITDFEQLGLPFGMPNVDYDGDGTGESFQAEIDGTAAFTYLAIQAYARFGLPQSSPVVYSPTSYPYWFKDTNDNGQVDDGEASFGNRYRDFDRRMLRAAFNFHAAQDPGGDIHNYRYVLQTLYDSSDILDDGAFNGSPPGTRP